MITILLDIIMLGLHFSDGQDAYGGGHSKSSFSCHGGGKESLVTTVY